MRAQAARGHRGTAAHAAAEPDHQMGLIIFCLLLVAWVAADVAWWRAADRRVRRLRGGRWWRGFVLLFAAAMALYIVQYGTRMFVEDLPNLIPLPVHTVAYLWHLAVIPPVILCLVAATIIRRVRKGKPANESPAGPTGAGHLTPSASSDSQADSAAKAAAAAARGDGDAAPAPGPTRREALAAVGLAALPVITGVFAGVAVSRLGQFRVRRTALYVPALPADLDGLTIAQITDLHIGKFLPAGTIER